MDRTFLKVSEAAEYLDVAPNTLRNWTDTGKIRENRVRGNNYRVYKLEDLIEFRKQLSAPEIASTRPEASERQGRNVQKRKMTFIDLFAGCGGFTLGLFEAGWSGVFGAEIRSDAFQTYASNFLEGGRHKLKWPGWLERQPWDIKRLISNHSAELESLQGKVDLVCGGPPCQGFSYSGRRNPRDPRNQLFRSYVEFVELVKPKFLLLENVPGFKTAHGSLKDKSKRKSFADKLSKLLTDSYLLDDCIVEASRFGVPQTRSRYFAVGVRRDNGVNRQAGWAAELIDSIRSEFVRDKRLLNRSKPISAKQAIGDLEIKGRLVDYEKDDTCNSPSGFQQVDYRKSKSRALTNYVKLMREGLNGEAPSSLRLPRHTETVEKRFKQILRLCEKGRRIDDQIREQLNIRKLRIVPLAPDRPAHTVTTLPDDLLHYAEPRILTVRECARLQSFPDWFEFHGKYTTGGDRRKKECPRYTQVGNAVPPLVAEAWGRAISKLAKELA